MSERLPVLYQKKHCYDILFSRSFDELWQELTALGYEHRRICIITDSKVDELYGEEVLTILRAHSQELCQKGCGKAVKYVFSEGEEHKTLDTIKEIYRFLIEEEFDRKDLLLALGGGVTGDITGYTAATYLRGIDYIQLPTTLLAQADSSIGGKTGVDFDGYKNMVGAFKMPRLVYMNLSTLQTLENRQFFSGFAEVMK
ncbi:MAG: 3-dehydroquinate synthase, partial [Lachnospiraceae bacterium]|nr:3-dehydroquinate synthase [Lachnospiraceae bacterium]